MHPQTNSATSNATVDSGKDLLVLSDEQILDIATEASTPSDAERASDPDFLGQRVSTNSQSEHAEHRTPAPGNARTDHEPRATGHDSIEPPAWLAAQMQDPWGGEEAREFWDGVQQARSEAAAYRAAIASPEDARALKELYPGGVTEARAAAERARLLEEVDRAYFGAAGNTPEQLSASRAQLAQQMLREDPAAFREMVAAGLQALQEMERGSAGSGQLSDLPRLAQVFASSRSDRDVASRFAIGTSSAAGSQQAPSDAGRKPGAASSDASGNAHAAAYAEFERAANADLERTVGSAIERTLAQALPVTQAFQSEGRTDLASGAVAHARVPAIRERLASSVRADVEKALQGDRQLGEQVAQILSARRFDNESRAQIVRLISERAQQLVPGAAKRVLNEWTQTTLAAHRGRTERVDATSARADVSQASAPARPVANERHPARSQDAAGTVRQANAIRSQPVNYRKLSDEQILDL